MYSEEHTFYYAISSCSLYSVLRFQNSSHTVIVTLAEDIPLCLSIILK